MAARCCPGIELDKSDPYRLRYAELIGLPASAWEQTPAGFWSYAAADPVATLLVALSTRHVLVGLFTGVLLGAWLATDVGALQFLPVTIKTFIVPEVADTYNASVLVLLAFIGGFVKLIEWSGGGAAFARWRYRSKGY